MILPDAGHFPFAETPQRFREELAAFLGLEGQRSSTTRIAPQDAAARG